MENTVAGNKRLAAAWFVLLTLLLSTWVPTVSASTNDDDGDGVLNADDDCPRAYGTSSIDRDGCPDKDSDGTSDLNDVWTTNNPNFQTEQVISAGDDYNDVEYSGDGEFLATVHNDDKVRIWNSTTFVNVRTGTLGTGATGSSVAFSSSGTYVVAGRSDDKIDIFWTSNMTKVHSTISVDVGSGDWVYDVEFSPNEEYVAVSIGRSGGQATNGQVRLINVSTGVMDSSYNPNSESRFRDTAFSPDGRFLAMAGVGDWFIQDLTTGTNVHSEPGPAGAVNGIAWSPDGEYIAVCEGYSQGQGGSRVRLYQSSGNGWNNIWSKAGSTSCYSVDFSPDSSQVGFGFGWYSTDGATSKLYEVKTGTHVDSFNTPRPNNCGGTGSGNTCGQFEGLSWHPDGFHIVTANGRNDEGLYFWFADLDEDNDGYNTTDQGDGVVDAFPSDATQWDDTDNDGFGDNPAPANRPDACISVWGNSTQDRFGCPDRDGDGWSDQGDTYPDDKEQWVDSDADGYGDNYYYDVNASQFHINQRGDAFPQDPTQWNDTDGDGWGDNYQDSSWDLVRPDYWPGELLSSANQPDVFPLDRTQWIDSDGDWVGDNEMSDRPDGCPNTWGDSQFDRLGCLDSDGDGWSDPDANWPSTKDCYGADAFPNDPTQWCDEDNDGYGSNPDGNNSDDCPNEAGTSTEDRVGCADRDGDGYSNAGDPFPDDSSQWADRDGDGRGDNPNGNNPDAFPDDTSQWKDSDGDGYGDNPGGNNGDEFPDDPTQWEDFDGDGFGDNQDGTNGDMCPLLHGDSQAAETRGCPDTDLDGYTDLVDEFPDDPFQWSDTDGDGFGDNTNVPSGDECIEEAGNSTENNRHGCVDSDGDGWADVDDPFENDPQQWMDTDGDGWGDNYYFTEKTIFDDDYPDYPLVIREQFGDAFPEIPSQWSDLDGDGYGDNQSSHYQADYFPLDRSQYSDTDGDGYGDQSVWDNNGTPTTSWRPDYCKTEAGNSTADPYWGCPDYDGDNVPDIKDPCPYDPAISSGLKTLVDCAIDAPTSNSGSDEGPSSQTDSSQTLIYIGGAIVFLLLAILVAQVAKGAARRKSAKAREEEKWVSHELANDEEQRRQAWIAHYVANGQLEEARALGWVDPQPQVIPQWKQYEMEQQAATQAAIPAMLDLDNL